MFALGAEIEKKQDAKKTPKLDSQHLGRRRKKNSRVAPTHWSHLGDTLLQRSVRHRDVMARTTELLPTRIDGVVCAKGFNLKKWRLYTGSYMKDQREWTQNRLAVGPGERTGHYGWTFLPGSCIAAALAGRDF